MKTQSIFFSFLCAVSAVNSLAAPVWAPTSSEEVTLIRETFGFRAIEELLTEDATGCGTQEGVFSFLTFIKRGKAESYSDVPLDLATLMAVNAQDFSLWQRPASADKDQGEVSTYLDSLQTVLDPLRATRGESCSTKMAQAIFQAAMTQEMVLMALLRAQAPADIFLSQNTARPGVLWLIPSDDRQDTTAVGIFFQPLKP